MATTVALYVVYIGGTKFVGSYEDMRAIRQTAIRNGIGCSALLPR